MAAVKFDSKCGTCGTKVAKGHGDVRKGASGKWVITCDTHKPAARPARSAWTRTTYDDRMVRMVSPDGTTFMVSGDDVYDAKKDGFRVA